MFFSIARWYTSPISSLPSWFSDTRWTILSLMPLHTQLTLFPIISLLHTSLHMECMHRKCLPIDVFTMIYSIHGCFNSFMLLCKTLNINTSAKLKIRINLDIKIHVNTNDTLVSIFSINDSKYSFLIKQVFSYWKRLIRKHKEWLIFIAYW